MTPLGRRIAAEIAAAGPIGIADYMARCLFDPQHGYYTTREPFGAAGDFTTAPEISQLFGELIAVWLYSAWRALGAPRPVTVAEIGPGRGTMMRDMLRVWRRLDPGFAESVAMVEASPRLAAIQRQTLAGEPSPPRWLARIEELPPGPLLAVGNEIFDAIPIRQYVMTASGWRERLVGLSPEGGLRFLAGPGAPDPGLLPPAAARAEEGAIWEVAPARAALMAALAARIAEAGGAGLFLDYGHCEPGLGDTLQAVRRHAYDAVLAHPGEADLTAHVDFFALAAVAKAEGLAARLTTQGDFLLGMGLLERAGALGAKADEATRERLRGEVERLAGSEGMGRLFKVLMVGPEGASLPPHAG